MGKTLTSYQSWYGWHLLTSNDQQILVVLKFLWKKNSKYISLNPSKKSNEDLVKMKPLERQLHSLTTFTT